MTLNCPGIRRHRRLFNPRPSRTRLTLRATFQPLGPKKPKKGLRREAVIPLFIAMVPKGGLARLSLGQPGHRPLRRGFRLTRSRASRFSSLAGRRPKPVRVPAVHHETKREPWIFSMLPGRFMVPKGGLEPPRVSPPPPQDGVSASSTTSARCRKIILSMHPWKINTEDGGDSVPGAVALRTGAVYRFLATFPFPNHPRRCTLFA